MRLCVFVCVAVVVERMRGPSCARPRAGPGAYRPPLDIQPAAPADSLQTFMAKVRELSAQARPERVSLRDDRGDATPRSGMRSRRRCPCRAPTPFALWPSSTGVSVCSTRLMPI